jgi:hypothetical protein
MFGTFGVSHPILVFIVLLNVQFLAQKFVSFLLPVEYQVSLLHDITCANFMITYDREKQNPAFTFFQSRDMSLQS